LTITPGWTVNVAPFVTETEPVTTYGLPPVVQVVFDEYVADPIVVVAPAGDT
jgi:hypothetical protein